MTSEMLEGFTSYGRPVFAMRITEIADLPDGETCEVTVEPVPTSDRPHNANDRYTLLGANLQPIAANLTTYAFAKAAALRWSRMLGEPVSLFRHGAIEFAGMSQVALTLEDTVSAHAMNAAEFATEALAAERGRLENAVHAIRENEMDMRAAREDAEAALGHIDALARLLDAPGMPVVEMARAAAETYETLEWYVLVARDDADMLGELSAR